MKKIVSLLCAFALLFSLTACGGASAGTTQTAETPAASIDVETAKGQDYIDYFKSIGLFTDGNGYEIWTQDHATYWPETPVSECIGWWDDAGTEVCVMILILDPTLADSSQEQYDEWMEEIKTNKNLPGDYSSLGGVDHLVGNVVFSYSMMTLDDDALAKVESAYEQFLQDSGATAEF